MLNGGALVRNSARSLKWLFIAYAPPVSELMTYIRACEPQVNRLIQRSLRNTGQAWSPLVGRKSILLAKEQLEPDLLIRT
jgi:hypothetical protein